MKKFIFFDIDGTLTNGQLGWKPTISQNTKNCLNKLEENGHFLAIATGRSYSMCKEIAEEIGISHIVCNGGNDVYIDGECITQAPLDRNMALSVVHQCMEKEIAFCVSLADSTIRIAPNDAFLKLIEGNHFLGEVKIDPTICFDEVPSFHRLFVDKQRAQEVDFQGCLVGSNDRGVYVVVEPDDKFLGIKKVMEHLQEPLSEVVVFGDGNNDIRMFQASPMSIAMGNAISELKEIADFVTHHSDEDGIAYACRYFGWI